MWWWCVCLCVCVFAIYSPTERYRVRYTTGRGGTSKEAPNAQCVTCMARCDVWRMGRKFLPCSSLSLSLYACLCGGGGVLSWEKMKLMWWLVDWLTYQQPPPAFIKIFQKLFCSRIIPYSKHAHFLCVYPVFFKPNFIVLGPVGSDCMCPIFWNGIEWIGWGKRKKRCRKMGKVFRVHFINGPIVGQMSWYKQMFEVLFIVLLKLYHQVR